MSVVWTTLKKELASYLFSPVGYLIAVLLYFARGVEVASVVKAVGYFGGDVDQFAAAYVLRSSSFFVIALVPGILTMRCFAEERRTGSIEVLLTAPVRSWEIVLGKWAAATVFFCLLWGPTLAILWVLSGPSYVGADLPFSTVLSGYLGLALVGSLALAMGCFTSSLTDNVLLSALAAILLSLGLVLGYPLAATHAGPYLAQYPWLATIVEQINVFGQFNDGFARGLIDTKHCVFYLVGTACFLVMTGLVLEFRRLPRLAGRGLLVLAALVALAIWGFATVLGSRPAVRALVDVSPQAQFTFSDETVALLGDLRERGLELRIDTFYEPVPAPSGPEQAREFQVYSRVQQLTTDLLKLYETYGGDGVEVTHHDVRSSLKEARERSEEVGLQTPNSVVVTIGKRHKTLSLNFDLAVIDFPATRRMPVPGQRQLPVTLELYKGEEAMSSAIRSLLVEGTPRAYFVTGYGGISIRAGVANSYSELAGALIDEGFEVAEWDLGGQGYVPEDADVVAVVEPSYELPQQDIDLLFAYVRGGGRLFVNLSYREQPPEHNPVLDGLGELAGFEVGRDLVAHLVRDPRMPNAPGRGGPQAQTLRAELDPRHPITRPLVANDRAPVVSAAREVRARAASPDGVRIDTNLVRTGEWAWIAPRQDTPQQDLDLNAPSRREAYARRSIGAVIDVEPEDGVRPGQIVLLGGICFVNHLFHFNGDLALNVFNWLASRRELVTIRGNRYASRRIELVPQQVERVDRLLIWYVPGALLAFACVVFWWRRRA